MNIWRYDWVIASSIYFGKSRGRRISLVIWDHDNQNGARSLVKCLRKVIGESSFGIYRIVNGMIFYFCLWEIDYGVTCSSGNEDWRASCCWAFSQRVMAVVPKALDVCRIIMSELLSWWREGSQFRIVTCLMPTGKGMNSAERHDGSLVLTCRLATKSFVMMFNGNLWYR